MEYVLNKYNISKLLYIDSDILFTADIAETWELLDRYSIVLTPHLLDPVQVNDKYVQSELNILRCGLFNGGFLAVANNTDVHTFLAWWKTRLKKYAAQDDPPLYADQKWVDLVPCYMDNVCILRDPGYNVGYWNLFNRSISMSDREILVNGFPLRFFHFSGLDMQNLNQLARHQNWYTLKDFPALQPLFDRYKQSVLSHGYADTKDWPYTYDYFDNGTKIARIMRKVFHKLDMDDLTARFGNPFSTGTGSYYAWLNKDIGGDASLPGVTHLWYEIYLSRPDIQAVYPDILGKDRQGFCQWCLHVSRREYGLDDAFVSSLHQNRRQVKANPLTGARTRWFTVIWLRVRSTATRLARKYIKSRKLLNKLSRVRNYLDRKFYSE